MENGYGRPSVTQKIRKQILKLKQIQHIFTHWMLLCDQLPLFVQSHSLSIRPLPKRRSAVAYGKTQFLNSNSKTGVQDPQCDRFYVSGGSRIPGGRQPWVWDENLLLCRMFVENCKKMKEIGLSGRRASPAPPPLGVRPSPKSIESCIYQTNPVFQV